MMSEALAWGLAAVLGAVLALDGTSVGQFMLSRPLVAGTLAGALAGSPAQGAMIGLVLEALHLAVLPVGATRYPEGGPAAVAAATLFVRAGGGYDALLVLTVFALGWEFVGGWTVTRLRSWNTARLAAREGPLTAARIERIHLGAVAADGARGLGLTAAGLAVASGAVALLVDGTLDPRIARVAVGLAAAAALSASVRLFGGRPVSWFAVGAGLAAASLWARA